VLGLERAQELARAHRDQALAALSELGTAAAALRELAHLVVDRVS
jgi:geranylgeranyl pyrophosphate synthase